MGIREGCVVDTSSVVGEVSGLVVGSVVTAMDVAVGAATVGTVTPSVGVVPSVITVVFMEVGCGVVVLGGWVDVVEAVGIVVLGGGCGVGEVRGVGVGAGGDDADAVRTVRVVEDSKAVGAGEVVKGGEEVRDTVEDVTVVAAMVTAVDAEGVDVFSGVATSGRVG